MPTISVICSRDITEDQSSYSNSYIACHTLLGMYTSPYTPLHDTIPPIPVKRRPLPLGIVKEPRPKQNCDNGGRPGQGMRTQWTRGEHVILPYTSSPSAIQPPSVFRPGRTGHSTPHCTMHTTFCHSFFQSNPSLAMSRRRTLRFINRLASLAFINALVV